MKLSIIIPAYNEEDRLPPMLEAYASYFSNHYHHDCEIVVVPNNCSDSTAAVAEGMVSDYPVIRVLPDPGRVGKGGAVIAGAREAAGEFVGFVDADGATPPASFNELVEKIDDADCIIASRYLPGSLLEPPQPLSRRIASRIFNIIVRILFGLKLHDTQCGAKLFTQNCLQNIVPVLGTTNWAFDVDMLFQVRRIGGRIKEIPTEWHDVAGSKIRVGRAGSNMLVALIRLRLFYSPFRGLIRPLAKVITRVIPYKRK